MPWLHLIRWKNLLIVFLTQALAWACIIRPMARPGGPYLLLNWEGFLLISLSTVLIAGAGYIINDYFDIKIDAINRPEKFILEKKVHRRRAIILHVAFNALGLLMAGLVAANGGQPAWLLVQLVCVLLLWFYSTHFKKMFVVGNVVVALLTALTIVTLIVYEPQMHGYLKRDAFVSARFSLVPNPVWVLGIYSCFAFVLTWMREVVKDMEDHIGDAREGCVTMPIRWGLLRTSRFVQVLSALALAPLLVAVYALFQKGWNALGAYTLAALILPLLAWTYYLPGKATTQHYGQASRWLKIIMVLGVGSLLIYYAQAYA